MKNNTIKKFVDRFLIKGLSGMALGLFSTLIIGLIMKQLGDIVGDNFFGTLLIQLGTIASYATGVGIGVGVAHSLKAPNMVMYASVVNGFLGAYAGQLVKGTLLVDGKMQLAGPGDPLGAFIAVVIGIEVGRLVSKKTKLDIIVTPLVTIVAGGLVGVLLGPPLSEGMLKLGQFVNWAITIRPFFMGMIIAVVMGMILTLPISSAAIAIIIGINGLAAGASTVGCAAQMVGFAVASYRENKMQGLLAQGLGTSMLQVPNIIKNPRIWIPPIIASAILGPISVIVFGMENNSYGAGMGTSGLVGQIMTLQTMEQGNLAYNLFAILLLHFVLPALITLGISEFMRKKNWIKFGDMKLNL